VMRRPKRGFACNVVDDWFRDAINSNMTQSLLDGSSDIYSYLRPSAVRDLFAQHVSGQNDNHKILFSLVLLEQWLQANDISMPLAQPA